MTTTKKRTSLEALDLQPEDTPEIQVELKKSGVKPKKIQQTAYLPVAVHEQLRRLAFEERSKMHDYIMEGLDRVFQDRGLPSISDLKDSP